jgi:hypothetical protein
MRIAPAGRGPGPRRSGLLVLALTALAFIATSPAIPTLAARADGQVGLGAGQTVDQTVRIHLDPAAVEGADRSSLRIGFRTWNGLDTGYSSKARVTLARLGTPDQSSELGGLTLPLSECSSGCDLDYVATFMAGPDVLPGSLVRYRVELEIQYTGFGQRTSEGASIAVQQPANGPTPVLWSIAAALLGLAAGWMAAPRLDRALGPRRRWPAWAFAALPIALYGLITVARLGAVLPLGFQLSNVAIHLIEPWSLGILATLAWGVWRGIARWDADAGWSLGLGATALTGLGGLWLGWWTSLEPVGQPIVATVAAALLGLLAGTVIGQGWRLDPRAAHDRVVAGAAVLAHGVVIAGFAFLAVQAFYDPFTDSTALLALVPAALIALALRRWFSGGRAWLVLFDLLVAGVGLLGLWTVVLPDASALIGLGPEPIGDVAATLAVVASLVAVATAFHRMPEPGSTPDADSARPISPAPPGLTAEPPPTS